MSIKLTTTKFTTTLAAAAVFAAPVLAQTEQQTERDGQQVNRQQEMSEEARACFEELQRVDQDLAEAGYGRVGPEGYGGFYGRPAARTGAAPTAGTAGTEGTGATGTGTVGGGGMVGPGLTSPRADMQTLLRAGYIMAMTGNEDGCQEVVQAAENIGDRYRQAFEEGEMDQQALREWRGEYLGTAVRVSELEQPMSIEEIVGADVRNMRDEDLGDVEDVVLGPDGGIQYVLIERGGFLGIGQEEIPVRWQDLRVTPSPYRDTLVMDVSEQALENAPRVQEADRSALTRDEQRRRDIDSYWNEAGLGEERG